jgi:hypothetical protein
MSLSQQDVLILFQKKKLAIQSGSIQFPLHGEAIVIELETEDGRFKFQADVNRKNSKSPDKITYQNRYNKCYIIRRLDFGDSHQNPPANPPDEIFRTYTNALIKEPHVHFYFENFDARWALPLKEVLELNIDQSTDDWYTVMEKFFKYCNIEGYSIAKLLFT